MFISVEQIKAARALLKWTQKDLATHAGVNNDQVHNIEGGRSRSSDVLEAMYQAFINGGIDFIKDGVKYSKKELATLSGNNWFYDIADDILRTLKNQKDSEVLFFGGSDEDSSPELMEKLREIRGAKIGMRSMIKKGDSCLMGPRSEYRWIPENLFSSYIVVIYGSKAVLDMGDKGLLINNPDVSNVLRSMYELMWNTLEEPDCESTANVKY